MKIKKILYAVLAIALLFLGYAYFKLLTGTVVDAETNKPVEGAIILAEWSRTKGVPGLTYGKTYKTSETITDKDGRFKISGVLNPLVNPPLIVVYKKGYVGWSNNFIFPSWEKRKNIEYKNRGLIVKLARFKEEFSHAEHVSFLSSAAVSGSGGELFEDAYLWERNLVRKEKENHKVKGKESKRR